jgi:hypothetical protein
MYKQLWFTGEERLVVTMSQQSGGDLDTFLGVTSSQVAVPGIQLLD